MPEIIVQAHPQGSAMPGMVQSLVTKDVSDNLNDDSVIKIIGEAIAECVSITTKAGIEPDASPFCVIVQFRS